MSRAFDWSESQRAAQARFRAFADAEIRPQAARADAEGRLPADLPRRLGAAGLLLGDGLDAVELGLLHAAAGAACASTRSLLTVQGMVAGAISRWGSAAQRARWLAPLARGECVAAFALSEPEAGSDALALQCAAQADADGWRLDGRKAWTSFAQIADVYLVIARSGSDLTAFLVERGAPGLSLEALPPGLGLRAVMGANLHLQGCRLPSDARIGGRGFGYAAVAAGALDLGRYSVACGAAGAAADCLALALAHARERVQFGRPIGEHGAVQGLLARMLAAVQSARLQCARAGALRQAGDPRAGAETLLAKYQATRALSAVAADAVQVLGARGCATGHPVERHFRDAKVLEIIEGTTQVHEWLLAREALGGAWDLPVDQ